jgi:hypothetical protein
MNAVPGQNPVVVRYLRGELALEMAAQALAGQIRDMTEAFERGERRILSDLVEHRVEPYEFTEADRPKLRALWDLAHATLVDERVQAYLASAGNSALDKAARLLAADVRATLGETHVRVVWSCARDAQSLEVDDASRQLIDNVQQDFQDTFVDTTWPACPRHPNHPLEHADGFWHCPRDHAAIARLGELSRQAGGM